jgi:hypothetical protein
VTYNGFAKIDASSNDGRGIEPNQLQAIAAKPVK